VADRKSAKESKEDHTQLEAAGSERAFVRDTDGCAFYCGDIQPQKENAQPS